jgi:hypothetical protein
VMNRDNISQLINDCSGNSFIKLAQKMPLTEWEEAQEKLLEYFRNMIRICV